MRNYGGKEEEAKGSSKVSPGILNWLSKLLVISTWSFMKIQEGIGWTKTRNLGGGVAFRILWGKNNWSMKPLGSYGPLKLKSRLALDNKGSHW